MSDAETHGAGQSLEPVPEKPLVFLSIEPRWAESILAGEKEYEYRRAAPVLEPPYHILLYATQDVQAVVGAVRTDMVLDAEVDTLIERTVDADSPHEPDEIRSYFEGKATGSAIRADERIRYDDPLSRETIQIAQPEFSVPQNFRYVRPNEHAALLDRLPHQRGYPDD